MYATVSAGYTNEILLHLNCSTITESQKYSVNLNTQGLSLITVSESSIPEWVMYIKTQYELVITSIFCVVKLISLHKNANELH